MTPIPPSKRKYQYNTPQRLYKTGTCCGPLFLACCTRWLKSFPLLALVVALGGLLAPDGGWTEIAVSGLLMGLSIAGKIVFGKYATERRMLASYDMCANRRMEAGEILKRAPMGYFNENRLGELTATLTTTLGEIETNAVAILDRVATGVVHAVVITSAIFWFD